MARQLSFAGTSFDIKEIELSDQFVDMYNASVKLVSINAEQVIKDLFLGFSNSGKSVNLCQYCKLFYLI